MPIQKLIEASAARWSVQPLSELDYVDGLSGKMRNVTSHAIGDHSKCSDHGFCCGSDETKEEQNSMADLKRTKMYEPVVDIMEDLIKNCASLFRNETNNKAERFMSVSCAEMNAKRVFLGQGPQYNTRCSLSAI
ncbi:hypothetical protein QAD02_000729 [Eretmocerus hayati]|uniref:Uncharacterized protein n=1 Tax=Eretmocerus hayati TaxID=131215 RepID=A0ACC2NE72_9HYME|nr:hypothetical protein QAD02_000729 [Eretmocerus hayati]